MKEVVYSAKGSVEVLAEGDYKEHHYVILNLGKYPTAYVEMKKQLTRDEIDNIECHGGISWNNGAHWNKEDRRQYVGWDYGHLGDWCSYWSDEENIADENRKYSTEEIYNEVKSVIEQVIKIEDN